MLSALWENLEIEAELQREERVISYLGREGVLVHLSEVSVAQVSLGRM